MEGMITVRKNSYHAACRSKRANLNWSYRQTDSRRQLVTGDHTVAPLDFVTLQRANRAGASVALRKVAKDRSPRIRISHSRHPRFRTMNLSSMSLRWASALPVSNSRQRLKTDHKAERCWMPGSLSDLSRPAAEIGDSARISPRFRHLCSPKLLKLMKILTRTPIPSLRRSKSDRLLGRQIVTNCASRP